MLNAGIVAVAAHLATPTPLAKVLWDRESLLLDLTETCVGILVAVTCALSFILLLVALPPVILLQRSLMHQQLAAAARTDPKTGLLNATAWQREADVEVARARRTSAPLSLLLVDVDHFKQVNDSHGHLIGDEVLRALATELRQQIRDSDVVGRFGGEEFTVLLPRTDGDGACRIAERLRSTRASSASLPTRRPTPGSASRSRSGWPYSASTAATCSSCSRRPTWPCTGPRTPAGTRCACMPRGSNPRRTRRVTRRPARARRLECMPEFGSLYAQPA